MEHSEHIASEMWKYLRRILTSFLYITCYKEIFSKAAHCIEISKSKQVLYKGSVLQRMCPRIISSESKSVLFCTYGIHHTIMRYKGLLWKVSARRIKLKEYKNCA